MRRVPSIPYRNDDATPWSSTRHMGRLWKIETTFGLSELPQSLCRMNGANCWRINCQMSFTLQHFSRSNEPIQSTFNQTDTANGAN
jgi:hypothetical protein